MRSQFTLAALGATLALAAVSPAMAANLITNGGFENQSDAPATPTGSYTSNSPTNWTTDSGWNSSLYNQVVGATYVYPHSGSYAVRFFGSSPYGSPATLSQMFTDVIGGSYTVAFFTYNNNYAGVTGSRPQNYLTAAAGGQSISVPDNVRGGFVSAGCYDCWVQETFSFIGTGSDTLSIAANTDKGYWYLDDVSVTGGAISVAAVPEPSTWAMMLVGFGGIGFSMRRRRRVTVLQQVA